MTSYSDPHRWECTGPDCRWEFLDDFAAEKGYRCNACGSILGQKPTQTCILVASKHYWPNSITKEEELQAQEDELAAVNAMANAGWKRGEARQWYKRRIKHHGGLK